MSDVLTTPDATSRGIAPTTSEAVPRTMQSSLLIRRLKVAQAIAGTVFSVFLSFHLANFFLAPFGPEVFNGFQRSIRVFYQSPLVEWLVVVVPLLVHVVCGVWLLLVNKGRGRWSWHRMAGIFLMLVIVGHVAAVRGPSVLYDVFPEFEGLSFSLWYFPAYFYPYYFLLAMAGFYHMTLGLDRVRIRFSLPLPTLSSRILLLTVAAWSVISLLALGGLLFPVSDPSTSAFALLGAQLFGLDVSRPWL